MKILKIGDFGSSRPELIANAQNGIALTTLEIGTPAYLAPEIINGSQYTAKIDVWSLGIILYEMLSMKHPFIIPEEHKSRQ